MIKAVIFDMDGVVVNIAPVKRETWKRLGKAIGIEISEEDCIAQSGMTTREVLRSLFSDAPDSKIEEYMSLKRALYRQTQEEFDLPLVGGVDEFIKSLRSNGFKIGLATSSQKVNVEIALSRTGVASLFDAILTAEDIIHGKPDPEVYKKMAGLLNVPPGQCLVFEDSLRGIEAGLGAGMKVCLVETTHKADELTQYSLWRAIPDFTEISAEDIQAMP